MKRPKETHWGLSLSKEAVSSSSSSGCTGASFSTVVNKFTCQISSICSQDFSPFLTLIFRFNSWQNNKCEVVKWETLRSPWSVKQADNTLTILCQTRKERIWNFLMAITSIKHVWMIKYQAKLRGGQEQQRRNKLYHLPNIPNVSGLRNLWESYLQSLYSPKTLTLWSLSNLMPSFIRQIL